MCFTWIHVMSCVRPAVLRNKNFNTRPHTQTVQPNCFTPAMLIGTIDFYFIPLSATLSLAGGPMLFIWSRWNLVWWYSHLSWTFWDYFWVSDNKGNNCCFADSVEKLYCWHAFGCLLMDLIQTWYDNRYYCTLNFDTSLIGLDLDSRSQECQKAKTSAPIISQSFQSIWMEFWCAVEICWYDEPHCHFILSIWY